MSRLQEYLKTPNPIQPQFFTPQSCQQDYGHNLFADQEGQLTKGLDESFFDNILKSPKMVGLARRGPLSAHLHLSVQKVIQQRLQFDDGPAEDMLTPVKEKQKEQLIQTTANKKYDLRVSGGPSQLFNDGKQSQRTLRLLTAQAYSVVTRKGSTTYKQVAEEIIYNTTDMPSVRTFQSQSKQQKNIKRRVYDALNVLIALGKLDKKGRKIMPKRASQKQRAHLQKICELKAMIAQKQNILRFKRSFKKEQQKKINNFKKLIQKNSNQLKTKQKKEQIQMPFFVTFQQNIKDFNRLQHTKIELQIKNNLNSSLYSDLNAITYLKFGNK